MTDYPESGLNNVELVNVPIWICENGHEELQIPAVDQLHALLTSLILRKPAPLSGPEIRFLRKELGLSAKSFAEGVGITPEYLSRIENEKATPEASTNLLMRLAVASELSRRQQVPVPSEFEPMMAQLETMDIGNHRLQHVDHAPPDHQWKEATV